MGLGLVEQDAQNVHELVHQELWDLIHYSQRDEFATLGEFAGQ